MILYENTAKKRKGKWSKHLMTDNCMEELRAFAEMAGLKQEWFQVSNKGIPHYDVFSNKIDMRILELAPPFVCDCQKNHWMISIMPIQSMVKGSIRV